MGEWREYRLCEVYDFSSGLSKPAKEFGFGSPFLSFKEVFYNYYMTESPKELVNSTPKEQESCSIRRGDVFLTRTSETMHELGMSCVALCDVENGTFNGFCKRLRPNGNIEVVPEYATYYFRSPKFRAAVTAMSSPSTRASLNNEMLSKLTIVVPEKSIQVIIGNILKSFDDKIELNRKMNETLEEMARAIFKSWFVDFDPVHAKARGEKPAGMPDEIANLFPSEFVHSDQLNKPIPKGWEVKPLGDCIEIYDSKRIPLSKREREKRQGNYPYYGAASLMDYVDGYIFDGIYLLLGEDGTVMDASGLPSLQYVWGQFWVNNHAHVIQGKGTISTELIYLFLAHTNIAAYVTGAVQLKLNQKNLNSIPFCFSSSELNNSFSKIIKPLFESYMQNHEELINLQLLRESLLPKLISGEIEV